jgi:eukaryotic-like serine/threonine-protein kinase
LPGDRFGHIVYGVGGSLRAVEFDPVRLEVVGDPVAVLDGVETVGGAVQFAVSQNGTLVYRPGVDTGIQGALRSLSWYDRRGREQSIAVPPRAYAWARLSPDERTIALDVRDQANDVWAFDLESERLTRVTTDPATDGFPIWTRDGRSLLFESNRVSGLFNIFRQSADGSGTPEQLTRSRNQLWPTSLSKEGDLLIVQETAPQTGRDLDVLKIDGRSQPQPLLQTPFAENNGELSPDTRWIAYQSNESGPDEIYVRPFPAVATGRWQVSTHGGRLPTWSADGRELFYLADNTMMAVPVQGTPSFRTGTPVKLFQVPPASTPPMRYYDVTRDGQRFLLIKNPPASVTAASNIVVVLNWIHEFKSKGLR